MSNDHKMLKHRYLFQKNGLEKSVLFEFWALNKNMSTAIHMQISLCRQNYAQSDFPCDKNCFRDIPENICTSLLSNVLLSVPCLQKIYAFVYQSFQPVSHDIIQKNARF